MTDHAVAFCIETLSSIVNLNDKKNYLHLPLVPLAE